MAEFSKASGTTIEARTVGGWIVVMNFLHLDSWVSGGILSMLVYIEEVVETLFTERVDEGLVDKVVSRAQELGCDIEAAANAVAREIIEASVKDTQAALARPPKLMKSGTLIAFEAEKVPHATQALDRDG